MPNLAVELERAIAHRDACGVSGQLMARPLAAGEGWSVEDVLCTSGQRIGPTRRGTHT